MIRIRVDYPLQREKKRERVFLTVLKVLFFGDENFVETKDKKKISKELENLYPLINFTKFTE